MAPSGRWAVLVLACCTTAVLAEIPTGQGDRCCAYAPNGGGGFQLVCNNPSGIPGAQPFPAGTIISGTQVSPGRIAQCVGRFPFTYPSGQQLTTPPNGGRCAGQFGTFFQNLGPDGGFVVQCTP